MHPKENVQHLIHIRTTLKEGRTIRICWVVQLVLGTEIEAAIQQKFGMIFKASSRQNPYRKVHNCCAQKSRVFCCQKGPYSIVIQQKYGHGFRGRNQVHFLKVFDTVFEVDCWHSLQDNCCVFNAENVVVVNSENFLLAQ
jgi:hypothetical protein